jgi:Tol biopolymer transport system component
MLSACNLSAQSQNAAPSPAPAQASDSLTVAWVEQGNLVVWQSGMGEPRRIASGGVIRPYLAPDGRHVVFTRGPVGTPETLWVVDTAGTAEQELVPRGEIRAFRGGEIWIGDVGWLDETIIYFNTIRRTDNSREAQDDLYRANIRTREVALILPGTEGGAFTFSPNGEHIAVVYPGTYGQQDGRVRLIDPLAFENETLLFFVGVSTGSEYKFYPRVFWEPDSTAMRVAIPDADLVYDDVDAPPTTLWRLGVDGGRDNLGGVPASFFGQPQWSDDVTRLTYLQRTGSGNSNNFELMVANGEGDNPTVYASGQAGTIEPPTWIPGTTQFAYAQGNPGEYWLGGVGTSPERLPPDGELIYFPLFVDSSIYVYATGYGDTFDLRYRRLGDGEPVTIATVTGGFSVFDAIVTD